MLILTTFLTSCAGVKTLEIFKKLEEQGIDPVLWGLTDKDFELLAKNFARIRNQLKITNDLLDKYKKYYETDVNDTNTNK